jgi:hypothetical protein
MNCGVAGAKGWGVVFKIASGGACRMETCARGGQNEQLEIVRLANCAGWLHFLTIS